MEISQLEQYLFSENKEEFIDSLIAGTDSHSYFTLINALNKYDLNLPKEKLEIFNKYKKFKTDRSANIKLRTYFMELANPKKPPSEVKKILDKINKNTLKLNFQFDEPKIATSSTIQMSKQVLTSVLDPSLLDWKNILESSYTSLGNFNRLDFKILSHLDLEKMASLNNFDVMSNFLQRAGLSDFTSLEKLMVSFSKHDRCSSRKNDMFGTDIFQKMSLEQMKNLRNLLPQIENNKAFIGELFVKEFEIDNTHKGESLGTPEEKIEKKNKLMKMYEWTKKLPPKFVSFSEQLLYEILHLGIEINDFDFDLFIEYLKNPKQEYGNASKKQMTNFQTKRIVYEAYWHNIHNVNTSNWLHDDKLIEIYLSAYFRKNKKIEPFDEYLNQTYLNKLFYKVKLYEGEQISNITDILSASDLKNIQDEKTITICKFNKEFFSSQEEVKLYVEIKNISNMTIKIFELSAEDYYLKKKAEITGNINVDGLIASEEIYLEFKEPAQRKIIKEFSFKNITQKKQGVFIVDFIGFGLSSRALIRKGKLLLIEKYTLAGQIFTILNEDLEICQKKQRLGMWVQGRFHEADEKGQVNLPFSKNAAYNVESIVVHDDFACLTKIDLIQEKYDFKCSYIYKDECLIMGNKMKLLIQPRLYLNQQAVSLEIIKNPTISISTLTETDIPSTVVLDNIKFDYKQELEIEVPIPAKLKNIEFTVSGKIKKMIEDEKETTLKNHYSIRINSQIGSDLFCNSYLRYSDKGYEIYVLGKNGEPKPNIVLSLEFKHKYILTPINTQLQTDSEGKISLGELKDIMKIKVSIRKKGDIFAHNNEWEISSSSKVNYPSMLNVCEGDNVVLPYFGKELNMHKISFIRILNTLQNNAQQSVIENNLSALKLSKNSLNIEGLKAGVYLLYLKEQNQEIKLVVNKGRYWKNTNLMVMKDYLLHINKAMPTIVIEDIDLKKNEEKDEISFSLFTDDPKTTRVHVLAYNFLNPNVNYYCQNIRNIIQKESVKIISNIKNRNQYLSNKTLGDEYCYVLNRKKESRYVGNTLEKPPILLKRTFVNDTSLDKEEVGAGSEFKEAVVYDKEVKIQGEIDKLQQVFNEFENKPQQSLISSGDVNGFLNFLRVPALIIPNVKPNADGKVIINDINLSMFSTVEIIATNLNVAIHEIIPLKKSEILTRDLRQTNPDNKANKYFSIFRNSMNLLIGEKFQIDDLTSSELQVVDSLEKMFNLQKELRKSNGSDNSEGGKEYDVWKFVTRWHTLNIDDKQKKYDEFASHELNLFLYFKDRAYFEEYIKPFIQNKIEKTFVDFFLLNNKEKILEYSKPAKINSMNVMEKILLMISLIKQKNLDQAKAISLDLENQNKTIYYDTKTFKRLFDTILGSKSIESEVKDAANELMAASKIPPPPTQIGISQPLNVQNLNNIMAMNIAPMMMCQQQVAYAPPPPQMNMYSNYQMPQPSGAGIFGGAGGPPPPPGMAQNRMGFGVNRAPAPQYQFNSNVNYNNNSNEFCFGGAQDFNGRVQQDLLLLDENEYENAHRTQRAKFTEEYKNLGKTKEYEERNYYNVKNATTHLITNNTFWVELAKHLIEKGLEVPFLSSKFIYCTNTFSAMLSVLAFIGLPFEYGNHNYQSLQGKGFEMQSASNCIVFIKEIKEGKSDLKKDLLIAQRFYDPQDRYIVSEDDSNIRFEKDVDEYVVDKIYGCEVIVTNVSVTKQDFQVLYEIPEGSLPIKMNDYTKSTTMIVNSFTTQTLNFFFYFPKSGHYKVYPANISRNGMVLAIAKETSFQVNQERIIKQLETIDQVLAQGSKEDILNFVRNKNLHKKEIFNFNNIYYLMKDKNFYSEIISILKNRKIYDYKVWSFSIYHGDLETAKEFLNSHEFLGSVNTKMKYFSNDIITIKNIKLLEYYPLMNSRVHQLSLDKANILNRELKFQYKRFLEYLVEVPSPTPADNLSFVYYLLLQDRIDEAIKIFNKINIKELDQMPDVCRLQYDYFLGYLDFYSGYPNFKLAREICEKYLEYPVLKWRNLFYEMANQLAEYDGEDLIDDTDVMKDKKLTEKQKNLKSMQKEEILTCELQKDEIHILYQNCTELNINYYLIDLEVLYSRNPFLLQGSDDFAFILANYSEKFVVESQNDPVKKIVKIPEKFEKFNVFIQIKTLSKNANLTYFSTSLNVHIIENYAQIKVTDKENKPLSKVYVKAFSKGKNGQISFYKDGYTDLRGRFDYASLNNENLSSVEKFSLFIMSDDLGSLIKEANPPSNIGKMDVKVNLKSEGWNKRAQVRRDEHVSNYIYSQKQWKPSYE